MNYSRREEEIQRRVWSRVVMRELSLPPQPSRKGLFAAPSFVRQPFSQVRNHGKIQQRFAQVLQAGQV